MLRKPQLEADGMRQLDICRLTGLSHSLVYQLEKSAIRKLRQNPIARQSFKQVLSQAARPSDYVATQNP